MHQAYGIWKRTNEFIAPDPLPLMGEGANSDVWQAAKTEIASSESRQQGIPINEADPWI